MTKDQADALVAVLRQPEFLSGLDPWNRLEDAWAEASGEGWVVVLHFVQGPRRYEQRFLIYENDMGERDVTATEITDWIYYGVLQEPLGDGSSSRTRPYPLTAEGRYLRTGWGPSELL